MNTKETTSTQKLAIAGVLTAAAVAGSPDQRSCCRKQMCSGPAIWSMSLQQSCLAHGGESALLFVQV